MATPYDFSNDDWEHVAVTPLLVGMAVAKAEDSGFFGNIRETRSLLSTLGQGAASNPARAIIEQVTTIDTEVDFTAFKILGADALATDAEDACRLLARILDATIERAEAEGYKRWVVEVAHSVAEAATEHGTRVSPGEIGLINRVTRALGLKI